jgi:hypothetical protein
VSDFDALQTLANAGYVPPMGDRTFTSLAFILALMVAAPASAAIDDGTCRNGGFPTENTDFGLAAIKGTGRAYLLYDMEGCPNSSPQCKKSGEGYVVPGNRVVTGRTNGRYVCAYYPSRGGGSAGWVEKSRLRALATDSSPPPSSWLGRWSDEGNPTVRIISKRGAFHIEGEAYWPGTEPEKDWPPGWPHTGGIDGKLTLLRNRALYNLDGCKVDFVLVGDVLIASDNDSCGGMNVRFNGVYHRVRR